MSELKIKVDPEIELALIRNITNSIINMVEGVKCTIMDFAAVAVEAYKVLDPFLKARDIYLDEFIQSSNKDGYLGVPLVNIYYNPNALASTK